ncbi:MAG: choice-of-anchor D domain-containing protein [Bacteroidales bacterium]
MKKYLFIPILILCLCLFESSLFSQNVRHTPYPIIFVHGIVGNSTTWTDNADGLSINPDGGIWDIVDFLHSGDTPLESGGLINISLDYTRNYLHLNTNKDDDVRVFSSDIPHNRDLYIVNFAVHATTGIPFYDDSECDVIPGVGIFSGDNQIAVFTPSEFQVNDIICIQEVLSAPEFMKVTGFNGTFLSVQRDILGSTRSNHLLPYKIFNLSKQSNQAAVAKQGLGLKKAIDSVKFVTGSDKVILVGHSMGGLAIREYIREYFSDRQDVAKIVTIGTPHYGSNLAAIANEFITVMGIDYRSDAIRDLKSGGDGWFWGIFWGQLNTFLFGGDENIIPNHFYSKDVNCDDDKNDHIQGLNENYQHLEEMDRTWIVSSLVDENGDLLHDGVVLKSSQFIYEGDTIRTHAGHLKLFADPYGLPSEPKDIYALIRGLDEPSEVSFAYEISPISTNKGFITYQIYNNNVDHDLFKINITDRSELTITVTASTSTGIQLIQLLNSNTGEIQSTNLINEPMTAILQAGTYYIRVRGFATSDSYLFPYTLTTSATVIPPNSLAASPENLLEYYDVVMNNFRDKTLTLTNNGLENISVSNLEITGQNADQFSITSPTNFDILPGGNATVTVRLNPTTIGEKMAELVITNTSIDAPTITISLHGIGVESATKRLIIVPDLTYNYGDNRINTIKNKTFSMQNTGSDALTVTDLVLEGFNPDEFLITAPSVVPFDLESGELNHITVKFSPLTIGAKDAILIISNNSDNFAPTHAIELYGNGTQNPYNGSDFRLVAYEYWFDNFYDAKVYTPVTPQLDAYLNTQIPTDGINIGLHNLHIRYKNSEGKWSAISSGFFHKLPTATTGSPLITAYEYWFDDDYVSKFLVPVTPGQMITIDSGFNVDSLASGLHIYRVRYKDDAGQWSSVVSEFFQKMPGVFNGTRKITAYEYWFDNDYGTKVTTLLTPNQTIIVNSGFDVGTLSAGLHNYQVRYQDDAGQWSSVVSEFFHKLPNTTEGTRKITAYEYWFDDDYVSKFLVPVTPEQSITLNGTLYVDSLSVGMHICRIRYKDNAGQWSSVVSEFILKMSAYNAQTNLITSFRYWFDLDDANMISISIPAPANPIHLIETINPCSLPLGNHTIHFQFKDTLQTWSSVVVNSFTIVPMTAPVISANGSTAICEGSSVTLTSTPANIYLWNTGESTRSIDVSTAGDFSVTVDDGCGNVLTSNTISTVIAPVPSAAGTITGDTVVYTDSSDILYTIEDVPGATAYVWELPVGATGTSNTNSISVSFNESSESGSISIYASNGLCNGAVSPPLPITVSAGFGLNGNITYNNTSSTPLDSLWVILNLGTSKIDSTQNDLNGNFTFTGNHNNVYTLKARTNKPFAGVNGTDALKIQRHFAGLETITEPVRLQAADVNNSSGINGTDAIKVKMRFVGTDTAFARGDWTFAKLVVGGDTIIVSGSNVTQDFYGLCVGDVNGSNIPSPGNRMDESKVKILMNGTIEVVPGQEFDLPIRTKEQFVVNAISLVIPFPSDLLEVIDVKTTMGSPTFTAKQGEIRIAWSEVQSLDLHSGDTLITLRLKATEKFAGDLAVSLSATNESELADERGNVIPLAELFIPTIKPLYLNGIDDQNTILTQCSIFPNPANDIVNIEVKVSMKTTLDIEILDMLGRVKISKQMEELLPGMNAFQLNTIGLPAGVYTVKLMLGENNGKSVYLYKLVIGK